MQPAGRQQALDDADLLSADLGPVEEPVLAAHRDHAQRPFQVVGVDRDVRITEVDLQLRLVIVGIDQGLGQRFAVDQIDPLALRVAPAKEGIDNRQRIPAATIQLGLPGELAVSNLALNPVELADDRQCLRRGRITALRPLEVASQMRPACDRLSLEKENDMT